MDDSNIYIVSDTRWRMTAEEEEAKCDSDRSETMNQRVSCIKERRDLWDLKTIPSPSSSCNMAFIYIPH